MKQLDLPDFKLSNAESVGLPKEFINKPFKDWEDARKGIEDEMKNMIDNRTYNIAGGINGAVKNSLGPFYADIPEISIKIFTDKAKVFEKEFLERCPGLKDKMNKDLEIREGISKKKKENKSLKKEKNKNNNNDRPIESDYEYFINYGERRGDDSDNV